MSFKRLYKKVTMIDKTTSYFKIGECILTFILFYFFGKSTVPIHTQYNKNPEEEASAVWKLKDTKKQCTNKCLNKNEKHYKNLFFKPDRSELLIRNLKVAINPAALSGVIFSEIQVVPELWHVHRQKCLRRFVRWWVWHIEEEPWRLLPDITPNAHSNTPNVASQSGCRRRRLTLVKITEQIFWTLFAENS